MFNFILNQLPILIHSYIINLKQWHFKIYCRDYLCIKFDAGKNIKSLKGFYFKEQALSSESKMNCSAKVY